MIVICVILSVLLDYEMCASQTKRFSLIFLHDPYVCISENYTFYFIFCRNLMSLALHKEH